MFAEGSSSIARRRSSQLKRARGTNPLTNGTDWRLLPSHTGWCGTNWDANTSARGRDVAAIHTSCSFLTQGGAAHGRTQTLGVQGAAEEPPTSCNLLRTGGRSTYWRVQLIALFACRVAQQTSTFLAHRVYQERAGTYALPAPLAYRVVQRRLARTATWSLFTVCVQGVANPGTQTHFPLSRSTGCYSRQVMTECRALEVEAKVCHQSITCPNISFHWVGKALQMFPPHPVQEYRVGQVKCKPGKQL